MSGLARFQARGGAAALHDWLAFRAKVAYLQGFCVGLLPVGDADLARGSAAPLRAAAREADASPNDQTNYNNRARRAGSRHGRGENLSMAESTDTDRADVLVLGGPAERDDALVRRLRGGALHPAAREVDREATPLARLAELESRKRGRK